MVSSMSQVSSHSADSPTGMRPLSPSVLQAINQHRHSTEILKEVHTCRLVQAGRPTDREAFRPAMFYRVGPKGLMRTHPA
jgi:hypothetical protein